jgi:hypothetical protein
MEKLSYIALAIQPATTDLHQLLNDTSEYAEALCSRRNNRFRYESSGLIPRWVHADGKRLQQILLNLLSNGSRFTRNGVVTLSVATKFREPAHCVLCFSISDTGVGMDLSQSIDIFEAFQQLQATNGGTGLGLFIAQRIAIAMGGKGLNVTSALDQGSTFFFEFAVPIIETAEPGRPAILPPNAMPDNASPDTATPSKILPDDQALDELARFALYGCHTDIELWMERHANSVVYAPFIVQLRDRLEELDFDGIRTLALNNLSGYRQLSDERCAEQNSGVRAGA